VQPIYMHPYSTAKMIATLSCLYGRRIDLNLLAGGFKNDLTALGDDTPHDRRYDRMVEFTTVVQRLTTGEGPARFRGDFYRVHNLTLTPRIEPRLRPRFLVSGSSEAGRAAAYAIGALPVVYPVPAAQFGEPPCEMRGFGIRVGIVAREVEDDAWSIARKRFPEDRAGRLRHQLAMKVSDSSWHHSLSGIAKQPCERETYWMVPFENYKTFCPYLVGSYDRVGSELARYFAKGCSTMILDVPIGSEELEHVTRAIARGAEEAGRA